jgi:N-acetylglutamate synthase-like GNAT family acetyltransferase
MSSVTVTKIGHAYKAVLNTSKKEYQSNAHAFMDSDKILFITNVTVREKDRGKGIGKLLVEALINKAKPKQIKGVYEVPEAKGFWNKMGIKEGKEEFYKNKKLAAEREKYIKGKNL